MTRGMVMGGRGRCTGGNRWERSCERSEQRASNGAVSGIEAT